MKPLQLVALCLLLALPSGGAGAQAPPGTAGDDSLYAAWRPLLARAVGDGQGDDPADLYKLLYQGLLGPAHAVPSAAAARDRLDEEWRAMADADDPAAAAWPLLEPIRPDSQLARVHLRPLAALVAAEPDGGVRLPAVWAELAAAFARTAAAWRGDAGLLPRLWSRALADRALWPAASAPARRAAFTAAVAAAGWPAVHHGEAFVAGRAPHYRVVARTELPAAWLAAAGWPAAPGAVAGGAP